LSPFKVCGITCRDAIELPVNAQIHATDRVIGDRLPQAIEPNRYIFTGLL
jgi:hypothetical protein